MLPDLLSSHLAEEVRATYPDDPRLHSQFENVRVIYDYGLNLGGGKRGSQLWSDAEAFLSYLETATIKHSPSEARMLHVISQSLGPSARRDINDLVFYAKRHVAAECAYFLKGKALDTEQFIPYERWITELVDSGDTVITFNYDCLLERLNRHIADTMPGARGIVFLDTRGTADGLWDKRDNSPCVLKLHGSIAWRRICKPDGTLEHYKHFPGEDELALQLKAEQLAILTPGPGKLVATKELKPLWDKAKGAIKEADAVVFIGYRFPPSDSAARSILLGAVSENQRALSLHTVLGPREDDDTVRLEQLLRYAVHDPRIVEHDAGTSAVPYELKVHRLWAQDFMTVATRESLFSFV
jgi:hypothetical protein